MFRHALPYPNDVCAWFATVSKHPWAMWLDSGGRGQYDIITAHPYVTLTTRGNQTEICDDAGTRRVGDDPLDVLRFWLGEPRPCPSDLPFTGGALGYWGYDLARRWINLPDTAQDAEGIPHMSVGIYDWALVIDHQRRSAELVSHLRQPQTFEFLQCLSVELTTPAKVQLRPFQVTEALRFNFSRDDYQRAFHAIQHYLHAGDCYQVNLAQRFSAAAEGDALTAYQALRQLSPAPFSAFLNLPKMQILCTSPERFLRVTKGQVETKPIKGTRPRGENAEVDAAHIADLRSHPKDRAENLMIVDLLRNDLGRCCHPGSVQTPQLFQIESYANVHHLVSTITGRLAPSEDALSLLRACFPGGSITGAPKQRAMQIIEELEPHRRGIYCGAIGYIGFDGNMDTNIAIRTLVYADGEIRGWAGGGIVADSQPEAEYQETLDKAAGMLALLQQFGGNAPNR